MDAITFKEKYMPHHKKLYRIAYRLLEDAQDAEDMVQEAYIKLWNKRNELEHIENTESYSVILLRNLCFDLLRSRKKIQLQYITDFKHDMVDTCEAKSNIEYNDEKKYVEDIISQLPNQQQLILKLKHIDNYSTEEIETITGLSSVNIRVLLSRARKKLKEILDKKQNNGN